MAYWSGWITLIALPLVAAVPLLARWRKGKRAAPSSRPIRGHVVVGLAVAITGFLHTLFALLELGSPQAIGAGDLALALGALAFVVLLAHTGLGLQLRDPGLRRRKDKRRQHWTTATLLTLAVVAHAILLLRAS